MEDKEFEEVLGELPRTFRPPVDPRYDDMWSAIEAAHFDSAARRTDFRRRTFSVMPWLAAAAALFIGIAIGRRSATGSSVVPAATVAGQSATTATPASDSVSRRDHTLPRASSGAPHRASESDRPRSFRVGVEQHQARRQGVRSSRHNAAASRFPRRAGPAAAQSPRGSRARLRADRAASRREVEERSRSDSSSS